MYWIGVISSENDTRKMNAAAGNVNKRRVMQTWRLGALLALATSGPDSQNDSFELSFSDLTLVLESGQIIFPKQRGE